MKLDETIELMSRPELLDEELLPYFAPNMYIPMLRHPLIYEIVVDPKRCAFINYRFRAKQKMLADAIIKKDWNAVIWSHERPYRWEAMTRHMTAMTDEVYWKLLADIWTDSENIFEYKWWAEKLLSNPRPGRHFLMEDSEHDALAAMPSKIQIYRGCQVCSRQHGVQGLSWTLKYDTAKWFAKRFPGQQAIVSGYANKKDVLAYFASRNEAEIVISFRKVKGRKTELLTETKEGKSLLENNKAAV